MTRIKLASAATFLCVLILACAAVLPALAMEPPEPGMLDQMRAQGIYDQALRLADRLGNNQLKPALRGKALTSNAPGDVAAGIMQHYGASLKDKSAKAVSAASARELDWVELDLNHDSVVDERDILALGFSQPKETASFPSLGTSKTFCLLLDFQEYPSYFPQTEIQNNLFGAGTEDYYYRSLKYYYEQASYGLLNIEGTAYGWHRASQPRSYYHPDDNSDTAESWVRQEELVEEAILAYDALGEDFSQYDNDGDGAVDYFLVVWAGPHGAWSSFWWGYFGVSLPSSFIVDGVTFPAYSWQWERYYGFGGTPPEDAHWDPLVTIHETGHALGLPDYYDYDSSRGPSGGVGGLDMMDGNWGDHNCFSKFVLGWLTPTIAFTNLNDEPMAASFSAGDPVIVMPGFDPVTPWAEYFMVQNRFQGGLDASYPSNGALIWHLDARVNNYGEMRFDNSYTDHKLLKLMEADGLNEIENYGGANAGDFYQTGTELSPSSIPNSNRYDNSSSGITVNDFSAPGDPLTADFNLYTSNPPTVNILTPGAGDTVSGTTGIHVTASDDLEVDHVQILIDGLLVNTNTDDTDFTYDWNSLVDFNKTLEITARAWDKEGQSGSMTISVTVSNAGVTAISDGFETGLGQWRSISEAMVPRGWRTTWTTRESPDDPAPLGSGREAYVRANRNGQWCGAHDKLRAMRLDTTGYSGALHVSFAYRCRSTFVLWATHDEGATWQRLDAIPESYNWAWFHGIYELDPGVYYLRLDYDGDAHTSEDNGLSANIDELVIEEAPSDPPTVDITSHEGGETITGEVLFTADATDDTGVAKVYWYLNGSLAYTDEDGAPYEYTRNSLDDDNIPLVTLSAVAEDLDGLPSEPDAVGLAWYNERAYPAYDDLESGDGNWGYQNDGLQPQWTYVDTISHSGGYCIGYVVEGGGYWEADNYDGVWFNGMPPTAGRQCIDLTGTAVHNPELTFQHQADISSSSGMAIYFYNTWSGFQQVGWIAEDVSSWTEYSFPLDQFIGQSGQIVFWVWSGAATDGTQLLIDDVRVGNRTPVIESLSATSAIPGMVLFINGRKFGSSMNDSTVTFHDGVIAPASSIIKWTDTQIELRIPMGAIDGMMYVTVENEKSNEMKLGVSPLTVDFAGLSPHVFYEAVNPPLIRVMSSNGTERTELYVDGRLLDASMTGPDFSDLKIPLNKLKNGGHYAIVHAYRGQEHVASPLHEFYVHSLRGDVDADGYITLADVAALSPLLGMTGADTQFKPWYDPDADALVTEADVSYIGYHFGESIELY